MSHFTKQPNLAGTSLYALIIRVSSDLRPYPLSKLKETRFLTNSLSIGFARLDSWQYYFPSNLFFQNWQGVSHIKSTWKTTNLSFFGFVDFDLLLVGCALHRNREWQVVLHPWHVLHLKQQENVKCLKKNNKRGSFMLQYAYSLFQPNK